MKCLNGDRKSHDKEGEFMYDVFLSYRRETDLEAVKRLAALLEEKGYKVWWDSQIPYGKDWKNHFVKSMMSSRAIVLITSSAGVGSWAELTEASTDNVLLEHRLAMELVNMDCEETTPRYHVVPVLIGTEANGVYSDFFSSCPNFAEKLPAVNVKQVDKDVRSYLKKFAVPREMEYPCGTPRELFTSLIRLNGAVKTGTLDTILQGAADGTAAVLGLSLEKLQKLAGGDD